MILEIDTSILDRISDLSMNQLVFLTLVLSDNQTINQDIQKLLSLVNEEEIQELESRKLITTKGEKDYPKHLKDMIYLTESSTRFP